MSICAPCKKLKVVSFCNDTGGVETNNFAGIIVPDGQSGTYNVYFKSLATGAIYMTTATTVCQGEPITCVMVIEFVGYNFPLAPGIGYEMWFNLPDDPIEERIDVTIDGVTAECFVFTGTSVYNIADSATESYLNQTLKIAD